MPRRQDTSSSSPGLNLVPALHYEAEHPHQGPPASGWHACLPAGEPCCQPMMWPTCHKAADGPCTSSEQPGEVEVTKPDTPTVRQQRRSRGRSYLIRGVQLQDGAVACQLASQSDRGACARRPDHVPPAIHLHTQLLLRPNTRGLLFLHTQLLLRPNSRGLSFLHTRLLLRPNTRGLLFEGLPRSACGSCAAVHHPWS